MAELSRVYPDGILRVRGSYSTFLEKKEEFSARAIEAPGSAGKLVHNEIECFAAGLKLAPGSPRRASERPMS